MAREYTVSAGGLTLANAAVTLVFINPLSPGSSIEILRVWAGYSGVATSAQQRSQFNTQVTAFPTLTAATPGKAKITDPASEITGGTAGAAGTAGVNASAEGAGTKTVLDHFTFNVLNGDLWVATPPETKTVNAKVAAGFGYHFPVAASVLTGWAVGLSYREL